MQLILNRDRNLKQQPNRPVFADFSPVDGGDAPIMPMVPVTKGAKDQ